MTSEEPTAVRALEHENNLPNSSHSCLPPRFGSPTLSAKASDLLYSQAVDGQSTFGPSEVWTPSNINSEVADDFDVVGSIDRVFANGYVSGVGNFRGSVCPVLRISGSTARPVPLQKEYFFTTGYNAGAIDVTLSPPFAATGKHFLTVQPVLNGWYWWSANTNAPHGTAFYFRDVAAGETVWHHDDSVFYPNSDVSFYLYGTTTGAGSITALSATTLERSGYLEVTGTNFGSERDGLDQRRFSASGGLAKHQDRLLCAGSRRRLATVPVQVVNEFGAAE